MNCLDKKIIKKSRNLIVRREEDGIHLINKSSNRCKFIFLTYFKNSGKQGYFLSKGRIINGEGCNFKLINRKGKVVSSCELNKAVFYDYIPRLTFIGCSIEANTEVLIEECIIEDKKNKEDKVAQFFNENILLITPGYPSEGNKYLCSFIHSRVQGYNEAGIKMDIASVSQYYKEQTEFYQFEGVQVINMGYHNLRALLQEKHYDKILIHFFLEEYAQALDACDLEDTNIFIYTHGADTLYKVWNKFNAKYFEPLKEIPENISKTFPQKKQTLNRYNEKPNVTFIFVSKFAKELSEKTIGIKYKNVEIVPCFIDEKMFSYKKRSPESRKKICVLRRFDNLNTYSIDTNVRTILELSKRSFFNDLEFSIYGDGDYHSELVEPLRNFSNVKIYKKFLSHEEMARMYYEHGIALFATRFETQGVAACEAASTGCVVLTSKGVATSEYIKEEIGGYADQENFVQLADKIEELYYNKNEFLRMSKEMNDSVIEKCNYDKTIKKDIQLIEETSKVNPKVYNDISPDKQPLLTIAIPSYNVEKYLACGVHSLLNQKYRSKLEVLIVNDGSKDNTKEVAKLLEKETTKNGQSIVKLIDKENGGHGSTINKGLELAKGKYFKLLDGDDYFISSELEKLLEVLQNEDSDLILTNYIEDFAIDGKKNIVRHYEFMVPGIRYYIDDLCYTNSYGFKNWGPLLSTSTFKTSILKKANFLLDEHCFYVDMELNYIAFVESKTVTYYPFDVYNYYLGREGQSVSSESFKKNCLHHEKVCMRIVKEYHKNKDYISENKKQYLINKIILPLCKTQYEITIDRFKDNKNFRSFDKKLKKYEAIYTNPILITRPVKFYRATNGYGKTIYQFTKKIYRKIFKK